MYLQNLQQQARMTIHVILLTHTAVHAALLLEGNPCVVQGSQKIMLHGSNICAKATPSHLL